MHLYNHFILFYSIYKTARAFQLQDSQVNKTPVYLYMIFVLHYHV
jgi:hypothetical protein